MEKNTEIIHRMEDGQTQPNICKSDPVTGPVWPRGWVEVYLYSSMTVALQGGELSAAHPSRTLLQERPSTHFTGGWVSPRASLDRPKISSPPGFEPALSSQ